VVGEHHDGCGQKNTGLLPDRGASQFMNSLYETGVIHIFEDLSLVEA
jgi:hypothetical protein